MFAMKLSPRALILTVLTLFVTAASPGLARSDRTFDVSNHFASEVRNFIRLLEEAHYNRQSVEPADYANVITNFMEDWDGQHLFFLESDRAEFVEMFSQGLYWNISALGRVDPAFDIFSRYEQRVNDRVEWILARLEQDFDLESNEIFIADRDEAPWMATTEEADMLWEKRLTFEVLGDVLNDNTVEEARERLTKRYERMLKNIADIETNAKNNEVAELFLTNVAKLYDPHSTYFSADTFEDFSIQMRLQLVGIGALLGMEEDECVIREIIAGGPADLDDRLKPNDKIIAVSQDGENPVELIGMKLRRIVDLIRGEKGTQVHLTIQPGDATDSSSRKQIVINRDVVNLDSARARGAVFEVPNEDGNLSSIGVISLPTFYGPDPGSTDGEQNSATDDIAQLIEQFEAQGIDGLVLDLRDNGGGLLSEAIDLTGLFIESGPVVQVRSYYGDINVDSDEDTSVRYAGPLAVLVSKFSASASEIVAGALQNYGRAVVLGDSSTHGKGTVQTVVEMKNLDQRLARSGERTGATKLTIQKFYLPSGSSTQLNGVVPDIVLPSIDEVLETGEGTLPHALVWDEIPTSFFDGSPLEPHVLTPLREASRARQESLPEFQYLRRNIDWFAERQNQKEISLNLAEREAKRDADEAFRESMKEEAKALQESNYKFTEYLLVPPEEEEAVATEELTAVVEEASEEVADIDASASTEEETLSTDEEEEEPEPEGYARLDIHLREALRVLVDAVEIGRKPQYAERAPLTAHTTTGG